MKQSFSNKHHKKFKSYFWIKNSSSKIEEDFYKKTKKYINYIKWIPWLKMIWIWNSISMNYSTKNSDIDLLIVTSPNRIWFVRIIITLIFSILWIRKTKNKHAWRFCLSFFATTNWLNFWKFAIKNDIYLYFWIIYFKPILNYDNTYDFFLEKNSSWTDFSEYSNIIENNKNYIIFRWNKKEQKCTLKEVPLECSFPTFLNKLFKFFFLSKTLRHFEKIWKPFWVIITNNLLKFHNNDLRKKIRNELFNSK